MTARSLAFTKAHEADPENVFCHQCARHGLRQQGRRRARAGRLRSMHEAASEFPRAHNNRGLIFMRRGDFELAFEEFSAAIKLNAPPESLHQSLQPRPGADLAKAIRFWRWPISPKRGSSIRRRRRFRRSAASPTPRWANSTKRSPTATRCSREYPKAIIHADKPRQRLSGEGRSRRGAGRLRPGLRINPNYVRAYVGRGQLFEKRRDLGAARADYRAASAALAKVEDIETTLARRFAKERLEALLARRHADAAGKAVDARRRVRARSR